MLKSFFKSRAVGAAGLMVAAVLCFSAAPQAQAADAAAPVAAAGMTQDQLDTMMHDYIMNHADVILDSVEKYQNTSMQKRQDEALAQHHEELFNNSQSPQIGNPKGDVTIVEFFDYNCHFCKQAFPTLQKMIKSDKNLHVIFKDFPILAPSSETGAKWALAAQKQGKYFEYHTALMDHNGSLSDDVFESVAKQVGLDVAKAKQDIQGTDIMIQIEKNRALASQMNFTGTPSFIVNSDAYIGMPEGGLEQAVAMARKHAKDAKDAPEETKNPAEESKPAK
jgi:protein-disulfide isomerase